MIIYIPVRLCLLSCIISQLTITAFSQEARKRNCFCFRDFKLSFFESMGIVHYVGYEIRWEDIKIKQK